LITVTALSTTPVKGTRLQRVDAVDLGPAGARGNRRFFVIDDRGRMVNAKGLGALHTVIAAVDDGRLSLTFPDRLVVEAVPETGAQITARFFSGTLDGRLVEGPFAAALSAHLGRSVRLVEAPDGAVDRGEAGAATLISRASLAALAEAAGQPDVDSRRFRMLIEVDGIAAHAEDRWVGRALRIGEATIRFNGHVGRCLITSRDPDTGQVNLPTLDILGSYRGGLDTTEPLPFGIYGQVVEGGAVRVGDAVTTAA
jgi:uncharacterized protein YcbX